MQEALDGGNASTWERWVDRTARPRSDCNNDLIRRLASSVIIIRWIETFLNAYKWLVVEYLEGENDGLLAVFIERGHSLLTLN